MPKKKQTKDYNKPISPFEAAERITRAREERGDTIKAAVEKARTKATEAADAKEAKLRERCTDVSKLDALLAAASGENVGESPSPADVPAPVPDWATKEPEPMPVQEVERG